MNPNNLQLQLQASKLVPRIFLSFWVKGESKELGKRLENDRKEPIKLYQ